MQRDIRRDRGQWRGCYSFKDIICDGDGGSSPRRDGGLKMGETYYFYVSDHFSPSLFLFARFRFRVTRRVGMKCL